MAANIDFAFAKDADQRAEELKISVCEQAFADIERARNFREVCLLRSTAADKSALNITHHRSEVIADDRAVPQLH